MSGRSRADREALSVAPDGGTSGSPKRSDGIDAGIAARVRAARLHSGLSQTALGTGVGVSFQQMQKYEKGRDRIAAGTLVRLAAVLGVPPSQLLEEGPAPVGSTGEAKRAMQLASALQGIVDVEVQDAMTALAETLAEGVAARTTKVEAKLAAVDAAVRTVIGRRSVTPKASSPRRGRATKVVGADAGR